MKDALHWNGYGVVVEIDRFWVVCSTGWGERLSGSEEGRKPVHHRVTFDDALLGAEAFAVVGLPIGADPNIPINRDRKSVVEGQIAVYDARGVVRVNKHYALQGEARQKLCRCPSS